MGRRLALAISGLALASQPGCITAIAAVAGGDARTIQAALDTDVAVISALAGAPRPTSTSDPSLYAYEDQELESREIPPDSDTWRCELAGGEQQIVRAFSLEGARAACLMSNDVDLAAGECRCAPAR